MTTTNKPKSKQGGYLRLSSVAKLMGTSRIWVYQLVDRGKLPCEEHVVRGYGLRPTKVVPIKDFVAFAKANPRFAGVHELKLWHLARLEARQSAMESLTDADISALVSRYNSGTAVESLAKEYGTSTSTMNSLLKRSGTASIEEHRRAMQEKKLNAKFSLRDKQNMVKQYAAGDSVQAISRAWACDSRRVLAILKDAGVHIRGVKEAVQVRRKNV